MPVSVLTPEQWQAIKLASIRGVSDSQLGLQFGVKPGTIAGKRWNDSEWRAAKGDLKLASREEDSHINRALDGSIETIASENPLLLAQYAHKKLKRAVSNDMLPEIESWSDAKTASEILRKACGLDKEQAAVSVNFWGGSSFDPVEIASIETGPAQEQRSTDEWI